MLHPRRNQSGTRTVLGLIALGLWCWLPVHPVLGAGPDERPSVHEIRFLLESIDPYLPSREVTGGVDVFASTTMDALAHGWAAGFKHFHPKAKIAISDEGSGAVFERLLKVPTGVGMVSRHVSDEELQKSGLRQPVGIVICHEALGVFVHKDNPLESISFDELATLYCADSDDKPVTWKAVGVTGPMADQPVHVIGRNKGSGSQRFVSQHLFRSRTLRGLAESYSSNAKLVQAVQEDPLAIAICGMKCGGHDVKTLHLREKSNVIPDDDHAILLGRYPLTRPLTLVLDAGSADPKARSSREFVRYALSRAGQLQTIPAGFFPLDPATLRGELLKVQETTDPAPQASQNERITSEKRRDAR